MTDQSFANQLAEVMAAHELEVPDVAHRFGVSLPAVQRWLSGDAAPHPTMQSVVLRSLRRSP